MDQIVLIGTVLNILLSSGVLWKLIDFARDYGAMKEKVHSHDEEIRRLRDWSHTINIRGVDR